MNELGRGRADQGLTPAQRDVIDRHVALVKLLKVLSAENCCSRRRFSEIDGPELVPNSCDYLNAPVAAGVLLCISRLPMPGRFVIGQDRVIRYGEVNPDYTHRPEPADIVPALRNRMPHAA